MAKRSREEKRRRGSVYLALIGVLALALMTVLVALRPVGRALDWAIRSFGLLGYLGVFLSALASAYMREMFQVFGRPFVRVHHIGSVSALALMTLHPLLAAVRSTSLLVFLPDFSSWYGFFSLGGRPAWYLIVAASLAGLLRTRFRKNWRTVHFLNYLAFVLATVHAILIGTDFVPLPMKGAAGLLSLVLLGIFVRKRLQRRRLRRR